MYYWGGEHWGNTEHVAEWMLPPRFSQNHSETIDGCFCQNANRIATLRRKALFPLQDFLMRHLRHFPAFPPPLSASLAKLKLGVALFNFMPLIAIAGVFKEEL